MTTSKLTVGHDRIAFRMTDARGVRFNLGWNRNGFSLSLSAAPTTTPEGAFALAGDGQAIFKAVEAMANDRTVGEKAAAVHAAAQQTASIAEFVQAVRARR